MNDVEQMTGMECRDMLEFLLQQFQSHSLKMNGKHCWRFRYGWPWTHARGPTIVDAVRAAMQEDERARRATQ